MRLSPAFGGLFFVFFGFAKKCSAALSFLFFRGSFFRFSTKMLHFTDCENQLNILKISGKNFKKNIIIYIDFCRGLWYNYKGVLCENEK